MKRPPSPEVLEKQCQEWNRRHSIGTVVDYHPVIGGPAATRSRTRSEAYVMSGHSAVVFIEEKSGCVALDALTVPTEAIAS